MDRLRTSGRVCSTPSRRCVLLRGIGSTSHAGRDGTEAGRATSGHDAASTSPFLSGISTHPMPRIT